MTGGRDTDTTESTRRTFLATMAGSSLASVGGCLGDTGLGATHTPVTSVPTDRSGRSTDTPPTAATTPTERPRYGLGPDTFERLSDLEVTGATLRANSQRNVTGTQCAELHTGSDGAWLHIPLDEPMDFTEARVACHVAREGSAAGKFPYVDLRDEAGNRFRLRSTMRSHDRLVRIDFGVFNPRVDGEPVDLSNITRVSFRPDATSESGAEVVYLDHLDRVAAPETPKVVFMFDDGNETDYTEALPTLSSYDYPAISYVVTDNVGNDRRLDEDQLRELSDAGWLIGSHTTDHTDLEETDDPSTIEATVRDAKQWLVDHGFAEGANHLAYPYDGVDRQALDVVSKYHDTARATTWQPIAFPSNPYLIPGQSSPKLETARKLLDWLVQYGGVLCIYYHDLSQERLRDRFRGVVDEVHRRDRDGALDVVRLDDLGRPFPDR